MGRAFLNLSLVLVLVIVASLVGVGGAALFIYRQMGNHTSLSKTTSQKAAADADGSARPRVSSAQPDAAAEHHSATPTVADSTEWHFAEFSDKPRYIDVTYDGGRQHARLKVHTVLSSPAALVTDDATDDDDDAAQATRAAQPFQNAADPDARPLGTGSRYITDPVTGRVVGIDSTAAAAMEVRRAEPVIRNPVPEVRVASPVMQFGRPVFDDERPVQAAIPVDRRFMPSRKALPVNPDDAPEPAPDADGTSADGSRSVRRATPAWRQPTAKEYDQIFDNNEPPARTSLFRRNRPVD